MQVTILDLETGEIGTSPPEWDIYDEFWWSEGNGSCDCNREKVFDRETNQGECLGCHRYIIIENSEGLDCGVFNQEYNI